MFTRAHKRRLAAALPASAFIATAVVSYAVGYGIGLGSNMASLYPSFSHLESRPNAQNDINLIIREAEQAQLEANSAIDEYNSFISRTN